MTGGPMPPSTRSITVSLVAHASSSSLLLFSVSLCFLPNIHFVWLFLRLSHLRDTPFRLSFGCRHCSDNEVWGSASRGKLHVSSARPESHRGVRSSFALLRLFSSPAFIYFIYS